MLRDERPARIGRSADSRDARAGLKMDSTTRGIRRASQ
ncbi:hypothetical protein C7S16_3445 [Burkholderia thailandensis]|uniref:Uncharacterized protein n=1 Tax=Burkholderia thailandensis TaxID=57975 RepID=A0AAW9D267_BURTH|nr:hypothetical protein [Burkholderia thailandensis]